MNIKVINKSNNPLPTQATQQAAGLDLRAFLPNPITIEPLKRVLIPTGLTMEIPNGYEGQVRPRSGLALKYGITVLNAPGTIDADYRGEIGVILINLSEQPFTVYNGDKVAQLVVAKCEQVEFSVTDSLSETERGEGGFNSTGIK